MPLRLGITASYMVRQSFCALKVFECADFFAGLGIIEIPESCLIHQNHFAVIGIECLAARIDIAAEVEVVLFERASVGDTHQAGFIGWLKGGDAFFRQGGIGQWLNVHAGNKRCLSCGNGCADIVVVTGCGRCFVFGGDAHRQCGKDAYPSLCAADFFAVCQQFACVIRLDFVLAAAGDFLHLVGARADKPAAADDGAFILSGDAAHGFAYVRAFHAGGKCRVFVGKCGRAVADFDGIAEDFVFFPGFRVADFFGVGDFVSGIGSGGAVSLAVADFLSVAVPAASGNLIVAVSAAARLDAVADVVTRLRPGPRDFLNGPLRHDHLPIEAAGGYRGVKRVFPVFLHGFPLVVRNSAHYLSVIKGLQVLFLPRRAVLCAVSRISSWMPSKSPGMSGACCGL